MDTVTIDIVTCTLTVVNHDEPWSNIINYEPLLDDAMRFTIDLYYIISYMIVPTKILFDYYRLLYANSKFDRSHTIDLYEISYSL